MVSFVNIKAIKAIKLIVKVIAPIEYIPIYFRAFVITVKDALAIFIEIGFEVFKKSTRFVKHSKRYAAIVKVGDVVLPVS